MHTYTLGLFVVVYNIVYKQMNVTLHMELWNPVCAKFCPYVCLVQVTLVETVNDKMECLFKFLNSPLCKFLATL
jgi:hypothetical protein